MGNDNEMEYVMITNEKRREIASRLRYVANDELGGMSLQKRLAKELELENTSWRGVLRGVAELIERPTCSNAYDDSGMRVRVAAHVTWFDCSECHCKVRTDMIGSCIRYCPNCGAEVVSDDD